MEDDGHDLVVRMHQEFRERNPPRRSGSGQHYTELPPAKAGWEIAEDWETYRREVGQLLAAGNEARYVLIKGREIIGIWDTQKEAFAVAHQRFPLQPYLIHQIQERERLLYMISHPI